LEESGLVNKIRSDGAHPL